MRATAHFDAVAGRWTFALDGLEARGAAVDLGDGVVAVHDRTGAVAELLVDLDADGATPPGALLRVREVFGPAAAALLATVPEDDVTTDIVAAGRTVERASTSATVLPHEPGTPAPAPNGSYVVAGARPLELRSRAGELHVRVPGGVDEDDWWVRVSDGDTGTLVALGRVRADGTERGVADLAFGLDTDLERLHVTLTTDPLTPVAPRERRRRDWARDLLDDAERHRRRRPARSRRDATAAAHVATAAGDADLAAAARRVARRAGRRQVAVTAAAAAVVAAVVGGLAGVAASRSDRRPTVETTAADTTSAPSTTVPATTAPATSVPPTTVPSPTVPVPRPSASGTYTFADRTDVHARLAGSTTIDPGETLTLTVADSVLGEAGYGTRGPLPRTAADLDAARATCRQAAQGATPSGPPGPLAPSTITVTLTNVATGEQVVLGDAVLDEPSTGRYTPFEEDCAAADFDAAGDFLVPAVFDRQPADVALAVPTGLDAGTWRVDVRRADVAAGAPVSAEPVVVTI